MTLDDFEAFSGRVLDYEWKYLGRTVVSYKHDDVVPGQDITAAQSVHRWAATVAMDFDTHSTTLAREAKPSVYEEVSVAKVKRIFAMCNLTEGN